MDNKMRKEIADALEIQYEKRPNLPENERKRTAYRNVRESFEEKGITLPKNETLHVYWKNSYNNR